MTKDFTEQLEYALDKLVTNAHNHVVKGDSTDFVLREIEGAKQAIISLIEEEIISARLDEQGWTRQKLIVEQAFNAPNSGFGRMIKWAIKISNERKLELVNQRERLKGNN